MRLGETGWVFTPDLWGNEMIQFDGLSIYFSKGLVKNHQLVKHLK